MLLPLDQALEATSTGMTELGRTTTVGLLRPGLPPEQTRALLGERGLVPSDDLVQLYAWHDGTDAPQGTTLDDMHLLPGFYLTALTEALANHDAFRHDRRWSPDWLPIFANGGGDFLVVTCSAEPEGRGEVIHFRIDESEQPVEFASISHMVNTTAAAYSEQVYFIDEDGYLEMDDLAFSRVASRLNPDVAWWQD